MVRPIEITDALSKAQEVGRMQQNAEMRPEAAQEFQKTAADKLHVQEVTAPSPTPHPDEVVLHIDEQEEEKRQTAEDQQTGEQGKEKKEEPAPDGNDDEEAPGQSGHIDIKV